MANHNYHWIQDDGPHCFPRRYKTHHYRERNFKYFMIACYGVKYTRELRVHSPSSITPRHIMSHMGEIDVHITNIYEPIPAINVQKNPFISFQARKTSYLKGWSTCAKIMLQKQQQN